MSAVSAPAGTREAARCFLALLPDAPGRDALSGVRATWQPASTGVARGVRWVDAASMHLTLRFFGQASAAAIEYLKHTLPTLAHALPTVRARRCAIWPNRARPRLLVLELDAPSPLLALAHECEAIARQCGFEPDARGFKAHLTLARLRPGCALDPLPPPPNPIAFGRLALMASGLHATGARYGTLASVALPVATRSPG